MMSDLPLGGIYRVSFNEVSTAQLTLYGFQAGGWLAAAQTILQGQGFAGVQLSNPHLESGGGSVALATVTVDLTRATGPTTSAYDLTGTLKSVVLPLVAFAAAVAAAIFSPVAGIILAIAAVVVILEAPAAPGSPVNPAPGSPLYGAGGKATLILGAGIALLLVMRRKGVPA